jgi:cytochrome bd ubiquinol oxidase subunit I
MRTTQGASAQVSEGNALFTLLGFMGIYSLLSMLYLLLMWREIYHGPQHGV